jgi:hypothetical protein
MFESEIFIGKSRAIDGDSTSSIVICEVTTLDHERRYDSMKGTPFVTEQDRHDHRELAIKVLMVDEQRGSQLTLIVVH